MHVRKIQGDFVALNFEDMLRVFFKGKTNFDTTFFNHFFGSENANTKRI